MVSAGLARRRLLLTGALMHWVLAGCAVDDARPRAAPLSDVDALLTPWMSISGGWRLDPFGTSGTPLATGARLNLRMPVGLAVLGDQWLVADAAARMLWRIDRSRDAIQPFAPLEGAGVEQGVFLQWGADLSVWAAVPAQGRVVQFDSRGRTVREWRDGANPLRPVAVVVPADRSELLVGDALSAQVFVFNPLGRAQRVVGSGRPAVLQSLAALAAGPRGLYVLDRVAQQVVVLDGQGAVVEIIGEQQLVQPRALAVDRSGRVFVSDDADQRIKVFKGPRMLGAFGGSGAGPGRFGRIESLCVEGNLLHAVDSMNARVEVLMIAPAAMDPAGALP